MFRPHRCDFDIHSDFLDSPGLNILHSWDIIVFELCLHLAASQCDSTSPRLSRLTRPSISTSASTSPRLPRSLSSSIFSYDVSTTTATSQPQRTKAPPEPLSHIQLRASLSLHSRANLKPALPESTRHPEPQSHRQCHTRVRALQTPPFRARAL